MSIINGFSCSLPGNHYGTPKPPKEPNVVQVRRTGSTGSLLFGSGYYSEGKKRLPSNSEMSSSKSSPVPFRDAVPVIRQRSLERARSTSNLGPLPNNWEAAYTEDGQQYFIKSVFFFSTLKYFLYFYYFFFLNFYYFICFC